MKLTYDGTEIDATGSNSPTLPYTVSLDQQGEIFRTTTGTGYLKLVWSKFVISVNWDRANSSLGTLIRDMHKWTGVIIAETDAGTFNTRMTNFNLAENGYNQVNISLQLRQT